MAAKQREWAKGMMNLALLSIFVHTCKWFFTCCKILWHGTSSFTSPPKEGMLQIVTALKNPSQLGFNLQTLGLMASMLTIHHQGNLHSL
jgi:hypothetical protein